MPRTSKQCSNPVSVIKSDLVISYYTSGIKVLEIITFRAALLLSASRSDPILTAQLAHKNLLS